MRPPQVSEQWPTRRRPGPAPEGAGCFAALASPAIMQPKALAGGAELGGNISRHYFFKVLLSSDLRCPEAKQHRLAVRAPRTDRELHGLGSHWVFRRHIV